MPSPARPVVLLEGTRRLPDADRPLLVALGRLLAQRLPRAVFRTGGAEGADDAFAGGVQAVDPARLEYVLPRPGHRVRARHEASPAHALDALDPLRETEIMAYTAEASPEYERLTRLYGEGRRTGALAAKTRYLLRDTLKVAGSPALSLDAASFGCFYVNEADPISGGTGHTLRVCQRLGVPFSVQIQWRTWLDAA